MKIIPLTRGKTTVVDDEDYDRLMTHRWAWVPTTGSLSGPGYAVRKGNKKCGEPRTIHMHREILHAPKGSVIDHANLNSLDNRKENLRYADVQKNGFNRPKPIMKCTSRYKGVFRRKGRQTWTVRIKYCGRHVELGGLYQTEEKAAAAYNYASRIFFGIYRHENADVEELPEHDKKWIARISRKYIERYGWYVDTETYHSLFFQEVS